MDEIRDRYEILNDTIEGLKSIISDLERRFGKEHTKDVVESLDATICEFLNEKDMLEERLEELESAEMKEQNLEFERSRL